ncbi:MAG: hypothetical protein IPP72_14585 [Chitinophagaceae bacterium]|nr:hypothetical protein [Chitinophagaceae bacterium]
MKQLKPQLIGLITGALMIIASVIAFYVLHLPNKSKAQYVVYLIYTTGIIWSLFAYHKSNAGDKI